MDKKKLLITGSCGFIFGNFIRKAIYEKQPYQFISLDRVSADNINSMYWNKHHTFHVADIRDQHVLDVLFQFEKPDIVIHGAAENALDPLSSDASSFISSNVVGTQNIINSCLKYGVKKLLYISTDEVYGHLTDEQQPSWTEEAPINPRNAYAASKAAGELLIKAAHLSHGLIYNIVRSSHNYGPRQAIDELIPQTIKCLLEGNNVPVQGQGLQIRDWTHVFDNCTAILTILSKGEPNEIYNISANQELHNIEVIQKICNIMGKGHELISFVDKLKDNQDFRYSMNSDKIKKLGWQPTLVFKNGIVSTIEWYLNNKWFLK